MQEIRQAQGKGHEQQNKADLDFTQLPGVPFLSAYTSHTSKQLNFKEQTYNLNEKNPPELNQKSAARNLCLISSPCPDLLTESHKALSARSRSPIPVIAIKFSVNFLKYTYKLNT